MGTNKREQIRTENKINFKFTRGISIMVLRSGVNCMVKTPCVCSGMFGWKIASAEVWVLKERFGAIIPFTLNKNAHFAHREKGLQATTHFLMTCGQWTKLGTIFVGLNYLLRMPFDRAGWHFFSFLRYVMLCYAI